jgi:hypothetical protein
MINQMTRRLDAEKIRQDFIKSKKLDIVVKPASSRSVPSVQTKPSN